MLKAGWGFRCEWDWSVFGGPRGTRASKSNEDGSLAGSAGCCRNVLSHAMQCKLEIQFVTVPAKGQMTCRADRGGVGSCQRGIACPGGNWNRELNINTQVRFKLRDWGDVTLKATCNLGTLSPPGQSSSPYSGDLAGDPAGDPPIPIPYPIRPSQTRMKEQPRRECTGQHISGEGTSIKTSLPLLNFDFLPPSFLNASYIDSAAHHIAARMVRAFCSLSTVSTLV